MDREVPIAGDRVVLTQVSEHTAIIEIGGVDAYSDGVTYAAYAFVGVEYIELPTVMEFVYLREAERAPERVPRDGRIFEFFEKEAQSDGGQVLVSASHIVGGHWVAKSVGFIVAESCEPYRGDLPSGNRWRVPPA